MIKNYQSIRELHNDSLMLLKVIQSCETRDQIENCHSFVKKAVISCENISLTDLELQRDKETILDFLMHVANDKLHQITTKTI